MQQSHCTIVVIVTDATIKSSRIVVATDEQSDRYRTVVVVI